MAEESFLLISLKEDRVKKLAQTIGNETARRILDFLAKKEATETEISRDLGLPLSTVHYNLQQLTEATLVKAEEFHYSEKGKVVNHYKLSNKLIIIAPAKTEEGFLNKLRRILPVAIILLGASAVLQFFSSRAATAGSFLADTGIVEASPRLMSAGAQMAKSAAEVAPPADAAMQVARQSFLQPVVVWFLYGAACTLIIFLIVEWIRGRMK